MLDENTYKIYARTEVASRWKTLCTLSSQTNWNIKQILQCRIASFFSFCIMRKQLCKMICLFALFCFIIVEIYILSTCNRFRMLMEPIWMFLWKTAWIAKMFYKSMSMIIWRHLAPSYALSRRYEKCLLSNQCLIPCVLFSMLSSLSNFRCFLLWPG